MTTDTSEFNSLVSLTSLFEAMPGNCILLLNDAPKFTILAATPSYLITSGYSNRTLIGKGIFEAFPGNEEDPDHKGDTDLLLSFQHVLQNKAPHFLPLQRYDLQNEDGSFTEKYWEVSNRPVFSAERTVSCIMHTAEDITEQIKAEKREVQIEGIEKAFQLFMHAPMVVALVIGDDHVLELANQEAFQIWGKGPEILGKPIFETLPELQDQGYIEIINQVLKSGEPHLADEVLVRSIIEGKQVDHYFNLVYQPYYEKSSTIPTGVFTISHNVTELVEARLQVATALEKVRLSKEAAELGTFDMDLEKGILDWDSRCRILFGITHQNAVTYEKDFAEGLHPDDRDRILVAINGCFNKSLTNGDYDVEYRTVGAEDGIIRWIRAKGKVYFNSEDKPVRFIGSVLDITEKVNTLQEIENLVEVRTAELAHANKRLHNINKELQRSNQYLEEFAYAASHDLKEPLRKILYFTSKLKMQLSTHLQEEQETSFERIENATERMGNLIDDLLLYSHVSQQPLEMESVDLNEKMEQVLEDLELAISEKKAVLNIANLPVVKGYTRPLQQLFQNLISNALKYSKKNISPQIDISHQLISEDGKPYNLISVKDNGIGFNPEYADRIFQMFARLHGKSEYSGTGLGLTIVRKVLETHNGFVRVQSTPDEGSTFNVFLPA